jgi:DNA-binding NarL/FixJ family response regulator
MATMATMATMAARCAPKILVVDDEPRLRNAIRRFISVDWPAAQVIDAASTDEALELLATAPHDVVLLDIHMPGKSGLDALKELRGTLGSTVPVIVMTALTDDRYAFAAKREGANAFVRKERIPRDLASLLTSLLAGTCEHFETGT